MRPELPPPVAAGDELAALLTENARLRQHVREAEAGAAIGRELVIKQFQEVERILALLQKENALRKGILDAAAAISIIYCGLDGIVRLFNRGAEHLLGYAAAEVVDALPIDRIHVAAELGAAGGVRGLATAARRHRLPSREWTYVTQSGDTVPVMLSVSAVLDQDEEVAGLMFAASDMSAAKAAQAALVRKNEEQAALLAQLQQAHDQLLHAEKMASLGQLAAGVAHEINNPIGYVNSNLATLGDYARQLLRLVAGYEAALPEPPPAVAGIREDIELDYLRDDLLLLIEESMDGLRRVTRIVRDLRTFAHTGEAEWAAVDLHELLDGALDLVSGEVQGRARVERRYDQLPPVRGVPSLLGQVFMNLLLNAVQAMREPGTITVATAREGDRAIVTVADTGCGIAPEDLPRIFDPFFTTKPVGSGTGLGLYLAFNIIRQHRGTIEADSAPGRGTTFTVRLPLAPEG